MVEPTEQKRKRERSPSYPAISLGPAVEKAKDLYRAEKGYPAPIDTILKHWGYRPKSGAGLVAVAALLKFGLLEDEGSAASRKARVTELAQRIIRDTREESPERDRLLRDAALRPQIHTELWERFGPSLPSDSNLQHTLIFEYGFTDGGAQEFIRQFKATVAFARLGEDADEAGEVPESLGVPPMPAMSTARQAAGGAAGKPSLAGRALPIPIMGSDEWPTLYLPGRITEADWNQMIAVLQAMKPGIVAKDVSPEPAAATGQAYDATVAAETDDVREDV